MKRLGFTVACALVMAGCDGGVSTKNSAAKWLDLEIDRPEIEIVEPEPLAPLVEAEDGDSLITRAYLVPPSFLSGWGGGSSGAAPDPFAEPPESVRVKEKTAREILESFGVIFGPGAWAKYRKADSNLIVRQTRDQMDLVEAINTGMGGPFDYTAINARVEIYEVSTGDARELERSASEHFENTPELNAVID